MRLEVFLARRLSLNNLKSFRAAARKQKAPGVRIAVIGIILSYIIMLLTLAIVGGFKNQIRKKVEGFEQQISISESRNYDGFIRNEGITLSESLKNVITSIVPDAEISLSLIQPAMLKTDENFEGILLSGIRENNHSSSFISENMIEGKMPDFTNPDEHNSVIISSSTANLLELKLNDNVFAHFIINDNLLTRKLKIVGIYDTHFGDYDKVYAYTSLDLLQKVNKIDSITGSSVSLNGIQNEKLDELTEILQNSLNENAVGYPYHSVFYVMNANMSGAQYFNWLSLLDTNVMVILILMGCVSAFTLISSLFIIILQHVNTIGLFKALGATDFQIRKIFILLSSRILFIGLLLGNIIGLTLIILQNSFKFLKLDPEAYFLDYVPVRIDIWTIIILNLSIIAVSFIILILPSQFISRLSPAKTLKYE